MAIVEQPAVWTWFHSPIAVRSGDATFITWHQADGIYIGRYNPSGWATFRLSTVSGPDDHIVAAIGLRTDGRILAVYSEHGGDVRQRISTHAGDVSAWGSEVTVHQGDCTYPRLEYLSSEGRWYLTFRGAGPGATVRPNVLRTSDDDGDTWSAPVDLFQNGTQRPYMKMSSNGLDRIDFAVNDAHPESVDPNATYHFYYDGAWRTSAGVDMGSPPFEPVDVTQVDANHGWVWDVALDTDGNPIVAYATFPSEEDHRYRYARWDGVSWVTNEIVAAGGRITIPPDQPYYSGGVSLDHANPIVVYASRQTGTGVWEINRHETADGGATWAVSSVTGDSGQKNMRPVAVRNDSRVIWFRGRYDHYFDFDTVLDASPQLLIPDVEPPPPTPPVAKATIRTRITWYGCDVVTGAIIAELPDIRGEISRVLGAYTSAALEVPIPLAGPGHVPLPLLLQATELGRSMIVSVINDLPAWAGVVLTREGGTEAALQLGCVSLEGYLTRREVGTHELTQVDEASIAATLAGDAGTILDVGSGIGLTIDAALTGTLRDRTYEALDRADVYNRLQELMAVEGGPEWTIDLDWTDTSRNAIAKILRIRDRVGAAASSPSAVFRTTAQSVFAATAGSEARYRYREDYSSGRGANYVIAYSSGEGEDQPTSAPAIGVEELNAGWPIYQRSWQPASNITSQDVLDAHAQAELDRLRGGIRTWQIDVRWDAYPRYGVDWQLGDDVAWDLKGHRHPAGVQGQGRAVGWALDIQAGRMKLILAEEV